MKREIKFRVWTGLKMEYKILAGQLGAFYVEGIDPNDSASLSPMNTLYDPNTPVMQFTGLKDKNGKEIYEGDIVKEQHEEICSPDGLSGYTEEGIYEVKIKDCIIGIDVEGYMFPLSDYDNLEVIGNIHQNPEPL